MASCRLGRKPHLTGDTGGSAAVGIVDPCLGQVQLPVDQGMPGIGGVDQVDGDLGVLDPPGGAGVLTLHPNRRGALLEIAGLVDDQHRLGVAEVLDNVGAHVIADPVVVPHRPTKQVLHPIRAGVAGVLGDRPAVLARQIRQQPDTNALARWRGSTRPNRPATRPSNSSSPACHRAGATSTLWPAATV